MDEPFDAAQYDKRGFWHEMLDRVHCQNVMFEEMILKHSLSDHPALKERLAAVGDALGDLYQYVGGHPQNKLFEEDE